MQRLLPILLLILSACSQRGDENLGLTPHEVAINVRELKDPAELLRAVSLSGRDLDKHLGAHRMNASSTLRLSSGAHEIQKLEESFTARSDGHGMVHLIHENNRGNGFEAIAVQDDLYVKPRYGRFVRRKPEIGELDRLRITAETPFAAYLKLFQRFVEIQEAGKEKVAGHDGLKLSLGLRGSPLAAPKSSEPGQAWRNTVKVSALSGEVVVDAGSGALLRANLSCQYSFEREQKSLSAHVNFQQTTSADNEMITAPLDWTALGRPRPMLDRQTLLKGLR